MKAAVYNKYGSPTDVLHITEIPLPVPQEKEVLVRVKCTTINDWDWSMIRGKPYIYRLMFGISTPKHSIPGMEFSGVIEAVGESAGIYNIGDEVFGDISDYGFGTFAEYICINENSLIKKPENMSFEEAAALSHGPLLAYQSIFDLSQIRIGDRILINGAGGGFGTAAVQILKQYDVHITGVDTGKKLEMLKNIGFDNVIDFKKEDFTATGEKYDLILDAKSNRSIFSYSKSLKENGMYITVGGQIMNLLGIVFLNPIFSLFSKKRFKILSLKPNKDIDKIIQLYNSDKIKFIIDGPYPFKDIASRIQYFGEGRHSGKMIISFY